MQWRAPAVLLAVVALTLTPAYGAQRGSEADFPLPDPNRYLESLRIDARSPLPRAALVTPTGTFTSYSVRADDAVVDTAAATATEVLPHLIRRRYANGVVEESTVLDGALAVHLVAAAPVRFAVAPARPGGEGIGRETQAPTAQEAWFTVTARQSTPVARVAPEAARLVAAHAERLAGRLIASYVATEDPRFDLALAWMKLVGEPDDIGGRVTAIAGRLLVTGRFDEARATLKETARGQVADPKERSWGLIRRGDAETTACFVRAIFDYVLYSGDVAFAKRLYPAILNATDGAIRHRTDGDGLLLGEPVHVQALWFAQLEASARLAHLVTDKEASERWERLGARTRRSFRERFPASDGTLVERLNADGSQAGPGGPRQILALTASDEPLLSLEEGRWILRDGATREPDESVGGALATALVRYQREDLAFARSRDAAERVLAGVAGDRPPVAPAHAAELVRVFYASFLGLRPDATAEQIAFDPTLPTALGTVRAVVPCAAGSLKLTVTPLGSGRSRCLLFAKGLSTPVEVVIGAPGPQGMLAGAESFMLAPHTASERIHIRRRFPPKADPGDLRRKMP